METKVYHIENLGCANCAAKMEDKMNRLEGVEASLTFATHRPGHNLDRARTQFKLVSDMERKWAQMHAIVQQLAP